MLSSTTGDSHGKQNRFQKNRLFQQTLQTSGITTSDRGEQMPNGWKGRKHTVERERRAATVKGESLKKKKAAPKKMAQKKKRK
jgi:hypothetical protein